MTEKEQKIRRWLRRHGWHTRSGTGYGQVWLFHDLDEYDDVVADIDPIVFYDAIYIKIGDNTGFMFSREELRKICELSEINAKALKEVRKRKENKNERTKRTELAYHSPGGYGDG